MDLTITSNDGLTPCDREPIHMPGSIQPHGMAIVAELAAFRVQHVAGDVEGRLGMSDWQNQPLDLLIGKALAWEISSPTEPTAVGGFIGQLRTTSGETLDVSAHRSSPYVIVELEAASTEGLPASIRFRSGIRPHRLPRLSGASG